MLEKEFLKKRKQPKGGYFYLETAIHQKNQDDCVRISRDNSFSNQSSTAEHKILPHRLLPQTLPQNIEQLEEDHYFPSKSESISINQRNLNFHSNAESTFVKKRCGIKDIHSQTSLTYKSLQTIIPQDAFPTYESIKSQQQQQQLQLQDSHQTKDNNNLSIIQFMNNYKLLDKDYNAILSSMSFELFLSKDDIIFQSSQLIRIANKFSLFLKGQYKELKNYDFMEQQINNGSYENKQLKKQKKKQGLRVYDSSELKESYMKQQHCKGGKHIKNELSIYNQQTDPRQVFGSSIDRLEFDIFELLREQEQKENESGKIQGQQKRKRGGNKQDGGIDSYKDREILFEKSNDENDRDFEEEEEGKQMNCSGEQEQYDSIDVSNYNNTQGCTIININNALPSSASTGYISQEINLSADRSERREYSRYACMVSAEKQESNQEQYHVKHEFDHSEQFVPKKLCISRGKEEKSEFDELSRDNRNIIHSQETNIINRNSYYSSFIDGNPIMQHAKMSQSKVAGYRIMTEKQDNEKYKILNTMIRELKQSELNQQKSKRTLFNLSKYVMQLVLECLSVESLQGAAGVENDLQQIGKIIERVKCQGQRKAHSQTYYYNSQFYNALFLTLNASSLEFVTSNKSLYKLHQAIFDSADFSSSSFELIRINQLKARLSQIILVQFKFLSNLIQEQKKLHSASEFNSFTNYMLTKLAYFDKVIKAIERLQKGDILTRF